MPDSNRQNLNFEFNASTISPNKRDKFIIKKKIKNYLNLIHIKLKNKSPSDGMVNVFVLETKFWGFESLLGHTSRLTSFVVFLKQLIISDAL